MLFLFAMLLALCLMAVAAVVGLVLSFRGTE